MKIVMTVMLMAFILMSSCNASKNAKSENPSDVNNEPYKVVDSHTSQNALDWNGFYSGTAACPHCSGIKTEISLSADETYVLKEVHQGKEDSVAISKGTFKWDEAGQKIFLSKANKRGYFVGENRLMPLDDSGNRITGELANKNVLTKLMNSLYGVKWKLVKLNGKDVSTKGAFMTFDFSDNKIYGNSSCNTFRGLFEMGAGNRILFSKVATTLMACPDMSVEAAFMDILNKVDNFAINNKVLSLNKARMAPLAVFETSK